MHPSEQIRVSPPWPAQFQCLTQMRPRSPEPPLAPSTWSSLHAGMSVHMRPSELRPAPACPPSLLQGSVQIRVDNRELPHQRPPTEHPLQRHVSPRANLPSRELSPSGIHPGVSSPPQPFIVGGRDRHRTPSIVQTASVATLPTASVPMVSPRTSGSQRGGGRHAPGAGRERVVISAHGVYVA